MARMLQVTFDLAKGWVPTCTCGWVGKGHKSAATARAEHTDHIKNECPIGKR